MSIIKKLVSSVLVATMLCALAIPTMAATLPTSNDMIVETRDNIKFLEETTGTQYAKYTLGNEIPLYRVDGADIVPEMICRFIRFTAIPTLWASMKYILMAGLHLDQVTL